MTFVQHKDPKMLTDFNVGEYVTSNIKQSIQMTEIHKSQHRERNDMSCNRFMTEDQEELNLVDIFTFRKKCKKTFYCDVVLN